MKGWGIALAIGGLLLALAAAFLFDTTATSSVPSPLGYGITNTTTVHNIGLMQQQELLFVGGCALFLAGVILGAAGEISDAMRRAQPGATGGIVEQRPYDAAPGSTVASAPEPAASTQQNLLAGLGIVIVVVTCVAALGLAASQSSSPERAAVEANAEAMADQMDALADNLEEMADNASSLGADRDNPFR